MFFDFIDLAKKIQPKIVIAENVKGLLMGNAKKYVTKIYSEFDAAGYYCQHFLLDASKMGVPQRRERVFFICLRKDLAAKFLTQKDMFTVVPEINMCFNEKAVIFGEIKEIAEQRKQIPESYLIHHINSNKTGRSKVNDGNTFGFFYKCLENLVMPTITCNGCYAIQESAEMLTSAEFCKIGSFPFDYNFLNNSPQYIIGMSVPPLMVARIANEIYTQWLSKINGE